MLLKIGVAMMLCSLTLAVGVAVAVVGLRGGATETAAVSSAQPHQAAGTTGKKREFNPGEKLKIDDGTGEEPTSEETTAEETAPPAPEEEQASEPQSESGPPPEAANWPRPTNDEVTSADRPRYFNPGSDTEMTLTVEALGLHDVPVINSEDLYGLDNSLMHVPETSFPWDGGAQRNVYIAGHYLGYPGTASRLVFYNLDKLKKGDEVVLKDSGGNTYKYRVSESFTAGPDDSWVMGQELHRDMVTLQTCIPPTFEERLIVRADRV